jgi:peptidoglycan-associated lipoprotein
MKRLIVSIFFAFLIAGCGTTPETEEQSAAPVEQRNAGSGDEVEPVIAGNMEGRGLPSELTDSKSILSQRSIYFDYDKFDIKPEYRNLIAAHAKFLVANRQFRMLIQGNTDERGSREYNLALGQKRADAIKSNLSLLGVREEQIESVSLGEEKPKSLGQDETAWAENRRGDLLYSGEF